MRSTSIESFAVQPWPRRSIAWIGSLLIVAIVAMAAWDIVRGYRGAVEDTGRELQSQARVIAEQTARSVQAVDVVLRHVAGEHRRGRLAKLSPDELHAYLRELSVGMVQLGGFGIYDANGDALAQSWLEPGRMQNIAELPGFKLLREDPKIAFGIGRATRAEDGSWILPLGRRLETASGEFAGIVGAIGRVDYFQGFYRDAQLDAGTTITLMHHLGTLLARFPQMDGALGKRFTLSGDLLAQRAEAARGPLRIASPVDGVERFSVLRPVPDLPLDIIVGRDVDAALAPWRSQTQRTVLTTLGLALLASLLLATVTRQFSRNYATHRSLQASRERFALAAAGSDDGIWDWDQKTDLVYVSARARELYGLPPGPETQPREVWFATLQLHPDDAPRRMQAMQAHMAGLTPSYEGEYRVCNADGSYRWIRIRGLCTRDASGAPQRMAGSVSDIDARKRAEEALRESEERYALAMAGSNEGHWVWDAKTDQIYASPTLNRIYGLPSDAQLTSTSAYFAQLPIHPDDKERVANLREHNLAGGSSRFEIEYRIVMPQTGEIRWLFARGQCFRDADGNPERFAGSTVDVTKRKRMQEALRESEERFALAVAGSDDGVWDWDFVANRAFESARARELQGLPPGPEMQPLPDLLESLRVHPDDAPRRAEGIRAHLAGETPAYECEYRVRHADNNYRWVRIRALCVRDASGKPIRMAGSVSDIDARKRTEESLRQSEERYALAMTGSSGGHWVWEVETDALFGSGTLNQLFGLPADLQPTTRSAYFEQVNVHPDDWPRVKQVGEDLVAGNSPRADFEYRILLPGSDEVRWILTRARCFHAAGGKVVRVAGVSVDVTDRKHMEEALRESEERFSLAVAGSKDGIIDWDIANDRMFASERAMRIAGIQPGTLVNCCTDWTTLARLHPDDVQRETEDFRQHLESQAGIHEGEYRFLQPDGTYRWVRVRGMMVRDASGRAIRWAGSVSDIDALKQAEQALRRSEERYQHAVAGSNQGLWDWDLESDRLFLSARAQEFMGLEPGEPLRPRREWIELSPFHPDDRDVVRNVISAHLRGETAHYSVEYRLRHASGQWRWHRQRGVALRDAAGRPYRMAGSMEDISELKNGEAERERLQGQLLQAKKLEAIGTLAGGIAHDFNNILAAILGYGEMAQKDAPEGSAQRRHIDAALSAGMRAKSLVERILAFSRSGMGERVPVHVQSVVSEALDAVAASLPHGVTLVRELGADDAAVLGDPTQVHQVVMNLCANAVQAMKSHGTLTVTLDLCGASGSHCATSVLSAANHLRLAVQDTGVGIAPHLLERIFDPFFTTKEIGVGTGLGLSLVHGIVTDLGGGIEVASKLREGSTFTVYLPWQTGSVAPPTVEAAVPDGAGETVLLVDDEEALVRLGEEMIAQLGYEPVGFTSSKAALAAFRAAPQRFDAVLSDEAMPEMTGSELTRHIRALRPDIPIVLMSGYVTPQLAARAREAGVAEVLAKPLAARDIARSLSVALRQAKTEDSPAEV